MVNKAYIYDSSEVVIGDENYETKDFFSYNYGAGIQALVKENFQHFEYIQLSNNDKLEILAYDRYNDESYADLIVMINAANFLWMVPYDNDIQISVGEAYASYVNLEINPTRDPIKDAWIQQYGLDRSELENTAKYEIIVPKIDRIQSVENLIKSYRVQFKANNETG